MTMPGFTAEVSVYTTENRYLTGLRGWGMSNRAALAGKATCTDTTCDNPTCTCDCPRDCTRECAGGLKTQQCCDCTGGIWDSVNHECI